MSACSKDGEPGSGSNDRLDPTDLDSHVVWSDTIRLEETDEALTVKPILSTDAEGNLFVADSRESQLRLYDPRGKLLDYFGRRGKGPGEFGGLQAALPRTGGDIVALDSQGKGVIYDPHTRMLRRSFRGPSLRVWGAALVNDSVVLVYGRALKDGDSSLLHTVDLNTGSVINSFFNPTSLDNHPIEKSVGSAFAALKGDTVAAVYSLSDTVYLFGLDGSTRGRIPLHIGGLRPVKRPDFPAQRPSMPAVNAWLSTFSHLSQVFWTPSGDFLVQYYDMVENEPKWRLARVTRNGDAVFDAADTPKLLGTATDGTRLYFTSPESLVPNVWITASLRR